MSEENRNIAVVFDLLNCAFEIFNSTTAEIFSKYNCQVK